MSQKLTILFAPMDGVGHVNACIGVAERLRDRGHKIVFAIGIGWKGKLEKEGFIEELLVDPNNNFKEDNSGDPVKKYVEELLTSGILSGIPPKEKLKQLLGSGWFQKMIDLTKALCPTYQQIVDKHKPNLIIIDHFVAIPPILKSGIPWVLLFSGNPLRMFGSEELPPAGFGM